MKVFALRSPRAVVPAPRAAAALVRYADVVDLEPCGFRQQSPSYPVLAMAYWREDGRA